MIETELHLGMFLVHVQEHNWMMSDPARPPRLRMLIHNVEENPDNIIS